MFFFSKGEYVKSVSIFPKTEMLQVLHILPHGRQKLIILHIINTLICHDPATQGARLSAAMIWALLYWNILVSAPQGLPYVPLLEGTLYSQVPLIA